MDIQYTAESSLAVAHYVTGYVTKAESSRLQELWGEVSSKQSLYSRLWSFGVRSLRYRECGLYEAADLLLGNALCQKSDAVEWISAEPPSKRKRRVKNFSNIQNLAEAVPDSCELFESNLVDTFYPQRPDVLEECCLYNFKKWYTSNGIDANGKRVYRKLNKPIVPNHRIFDPNKEDQREDYFYSLILLFVPFRNESDLIKSGQTAEEAFNDFMASSGDMADHHSSLLKMLNAQSKVRNINEHREKHKEVAVESKDDNRQEGPEIAGEAAAAMDDVRDCNTAHDIDIGERILMLNADQRRTFDNLNDHLHHQYRHEQGECNCDGFKPIHMFISGVGGTGKSFLIETIRSQVNEIWKASVTNGEATCVVAAPTGLAAYNVSGVTVHRLFQLPIEHEGKTAGYWSLPKASQKVMRANLRSLKLVIIDEISMLSNLNLAYVHLRLDEMFGESSDWFGSTNVLFVGDILQLPPVNGQPVFTKLENKAIASRLGCITCVNIWRDTVVYDELTINERQKDDAQFTKILDEVRRGCPSSESLECLKERVMKGSISDKFKELSEAGSVPVCLFPTRKACEQHNLEMLNKLDTEIRKISCTDEIDETMGTRRWSKRSAEQLQKLNKDCNLTAGLEAELLIAVGARVMLRRNIDTKQGLVNGAIGTVVNITSQHVTVKFDHINEPCPIEMVRSKFLLMKSFHIYRKQFPLILAYAVTIHKCQGLSLDCAIVDLSNKIFCSGMAYVALSRVRSLKGLYLTDFDPASIIVSSTCLEEVNRLRSLYRKDLPCYDIPKKSAKRAVKRKFDCTVDGAGGEPKAKKLTLPVDHKQVAGKKRPRPSTSKSTDSNKAKKQASDDDCVLTGAVSAEFPYYPIDNNWQLQTCHNLGLQYHEQFACQAGSPETVLTRPNLRTLKRIGDDGNCLFRAFSFVITGSEEQHFIVRSVLISHMLSISHLLVGRGPDGRRNYADALTIRDHSDVEEYIQLTGMDRDGTWGSAVETASLSHLLNCPIYMYDVSHEIARWTTYFPCYIERSLMRNVHCMSLYFHFTGNHFNVIRCMGRR